MTPKAALAQLHVLYDQMTNGQVTNVPKAGRLLLGPALDTLERLYGGLPISDFIEELWAENDRLRDALEAEGLL